MLNVFQHPCCGPHCPRLRVCAAGEIFAEGTPEQVAKEPRSFTGQYLAPLLKT